ncbi:MAG: Dam family site-specific DNA-(adenine-N6)-methyltransferase [Xanthobacteraceae bacterium]|nr:Dam family site-specific DNA-(adenine-N6)-methyltransferase [Xanthobacteraceae bacterium]
MSFDPPRAKPFLRWAGSKRKLLGRLGVFWSQQHTAYVEPFAGSACLFFELAPKAAVLGDTNSELIELFEVVRDAPDRLHRRLTRIRRDLDTYNRWRRMSPSAMDRETRALRFLYLNRNCFNGIYRTNTNGQFNVPMGRKQGTYIQRDELARCSAMLKNVTLVSGDFTDTLAHVKPGNFVYLDPPYAVNSRRIFRQYGKKVFDTSDIKRFSEALVGIDKSKADFLVSYADCREARALASHWNSVRFPVRRNIAGFAGARRNAYEWLITNCPDRTTELAAWPN